MQQELEETLRQLIYEETLYLRHYRAEVQDNKDPMNKNRVSVLIYDLGIDNPDIAIWCTSRFSNSCIIPAVGDWVEVYFMNGNRHQPVYIPLVAEMQGMESQTYSGTPTKRILYENRQSKKNIEYDDSTDILTIMQGADFAVRYSKLESAFNQLKSDFNTFKANHKHTGVTTGNGSSGVSDMPNPSSADISQAKVEKVKIP